MKTCTNQASLTPGTFNLYDAFNSPAVNILRNRTKVLLTYVLLPYSRYIASQEDRWICTEPVTTTANVNRMQVVIGQENSDEIG